MEFITDIAQCNRSFFSRFYVEIIQKFPSFVCCSPVNPYLITVLTYNEFFIFAFVRCVSLDDFITFNLHYELCYFITHNYDFRLI